VQLQQRIDYVTSRSRWRWN